MTKTRHDAKQPRALLFGRRSHLPARGCRCPVCAKSLRQSRTCVNLIGGASALLEGGETYGPSESMLGYFNLSWERWLEGKDEGSFLHASLPIAEAVRGGQFSIRVCSLACLRQLFASWVDHLEALARQHTEEAGIDWKPEP